MLTPSNTSPSRLSGSEVFFFCKFYSSSFPGGFISPAARPPLKRNAKTAASQRNPWVSLGISSSSQTPFHAAEMPNAKSSPHPLTPMPQNTVFFFGFSPRPLFFLSSISQGYASKLASHASRWKHRVLSCRDRLLRWKGWVFGSRRRVLVFFLAVIEKYVDAAAFFHPKEIRIFFSNSVGSSQKYECGRSYVAEHHRSGEYFGKV